MAMLAKWQAVTERCWTSRSEAGLWRVPDALEEVGHVGQRVVAEAGVGRKRLGA